MGRLLGLIVFFVIAGSVALHMEADIPAFARWIGQLPGDLIITKGKITMHLPFTSSVLVSGAISIVLSIFSK